MHPPEPVSLSAEPIPLGVVDDRPPAMPRRLRVLRVLFGLAVGLCVVALVGAVLQVIGLVLVPVPGSDAAEYTTFELVFPFVWFPLLGAAYLIAAIRLGRGGASARRWALVAIGADAVVALLATGAYALVGTAGPADLLQLVMPGLMALLLLTRASREWFRATA